MDSLKHYSPGEERVNISSHALGLVLSGVALVAMLTRAIQYGTIWHIVSVSIFGASLISLYTASTFYHGSKEPSLRSRLRIMDHATIYVLIAGTYTPFGLVTLHGPTGWTLFAVTWSMAVAGVVLKIFFTGKYDLLSTLLYVFMGWIVVFAINPLMDKLSSDGIFWLFAGGVAYTVGAAVYSIKKIKFNHAVFHLFVLLGSFCHFFAVYNHVLPTG